MGSTRPRRVTSPVIARPGFTALPLIAEKSAVVMVIPAEGPSLGMAPAGTWMWMSTVSKYSGSTPSSLLRLRQ